jgi:hypothetical protein
VFGVCVGGLGFDVVVNTGCLIVEVVDDVTVRWAAGRRFAWLGMGAEGFTLTGEAGGASEGNLEDETGRSAILVGVEITSVSASSSLSGAGVTLGCRFGSTGVGGVSALSFTMPTLLSCRVGDPERPRLLDGRAKGLDGLSDVWPICEGRRPNGLAFSGDNEFTFVGERWIEVTFVGDCVGVEARTVVAGEELFWRRNGDWRPVSMESGAGLSEEDWSW